MIHSNTPVDSSRHTRVFKAEKGEADSLGTSVRTLVNQEQFNTICTAGDWISHLRVLRARRLGILQNVFEHGKKK